MENIQLTNVADFRQQIHDRLEKANLDEQGVIVMILNPSMQGHELMTNMPRRVVPDMLMLLSIALLQGS